MKTYQNHPQEIITNARQGLPLSAANRKKRHKRPFGLLVLAACLAFWGGVAAIVASL